MIMNMKQKEIKIEPRIKLNYNMYTSSRGKINYSHSKSEFQMFSLISGRHVADPQKDTNMASAYWALYIFGKHFGK